VIAQRNLLTCRTRRKVLDDLASAAADTEDSHVRTCVVVVHVVVVGKTKFGLLVGNLVRLGKVRRRCIPKY